MRSLGHAAYRAGNFARARKHFERALALFAQDGAAAHADAPGTLCDLGAACTAMGDHASAITAQEDALRRRRETLGVAHQDVGISLQNLGAAYNAAGDTALAEDCFTEAADCLRASLGPLHPLSARPLTSLSFIALQRGDTATAVTRAREALAIAEQALPPNDPAVVGALDHLGSCLSAAGQSAEACLHWKAARHALGARDPARSALLLTRIGIAQRTMGALPDAAQSFSAALQIQPTLAIARHNLAATLTRLGRHDLAAPHRRQALKHQSVFAEPAGPGAPAVLILCIADDGNVPLDHILPHGRATRIWWFIDHAQDAAATPLPPFDIVFNAVGDPDKSHASDTRIAAFRAVCRARFLNEPDHVARTRRDRLPMLLDGITGLQTPPVLRVGLHDLSDAAREAGQTFPLLLRPAGAHGGKGVLRFDRLEDITPIFNADHAAWYLSPFRDCRAADGYYRKYRVIFVDRLPFAYHLAISPHWLVHYHSSDMEAHDWKLTEEAAFLSDPETAFGTAAWRAIRQAGERIDLDYCGMDFTITAEGDVLVFEANATMLVHPEDPHGRLAFKNEAVQQVADAVEEMFFSEKKNQKTFSTLHVRQRG